MTPPSPSATLKRRCLTSSKSSMPLTPATRRPARRRLASCQSNPTLNEEIIAEALDGGQVQAECGGQLSDSCAAEGPGRSAAAEELGGDVGVHFINQAGLQEAPQYRRAAFDQEISELPFCSQFMEKRKHLIAPSAFRWRPAFAAGMLKLLFSRKLRVWTVYQQNGSFAR